MKKKCDTCAWSSKSVYANYCYNDTSKKYNTKVKPNDKCDKWEESEYAKYIYKQ